MAMLQLGGTLSNATVRITPRLSLWVTAQHLLSVSSVAPNPDTVVNTVKDEKSENDQIKTKYSKQNLVGDQTLVTTVFKNLNESPEDENVETQKKQKHSQLNNTKIHSATNINDLLNVSQNPGFNQQNASAIVYVLCNWITTGKIAMTDIKNDLRYLKVCRILGIEKQSSNIFGAKVSLENDKYNPGLYPILQAENVNKQLDSLNTHEMVSLLTTLANKQKRSAPTLHILAQKIFNSNDKLNIKQLADILYSMAVLNFYDEKLISKTSRDLLKVIEKNKNTAVIGSILTSMGILRYRDEDLLDSLSSWIVNNEDVIRPREISSLLKTLATVGYIPNNFDKIFENVVMPLKEGDMCQSGEWLDIVWALALMNKATPQHYESVLNSGFLNRIFDTTNAVAARIIKLLNVNAAARLIVPDYKGPLIPENSSLLSTTIARPKDKFELSHAMISALKLLLPSDSIYLNANINTEMGFTLDAEFCVDSNCTPRPLDSKSEQDKQVFRIAVVTCSYHEFCRKTNEIIGPVKFCNKLLELKGYKVLLVPYSEVNTREKLVLRVKYIKDNVKKLVQNVPES